MFLKLYRNNICYFFQTIEVTYMPAYNDDFFFFYLYENIIIITLAHRYRNKNL